MFSVDLDNDANWLLAIHGKNGVDNNETTPLLPDSLLGGFSKSSESRISETMYKYKIMTLCLENRKSLVVR